MTSMNVQEVMEYLPHRYPFLLVDRVLECQPGDFVVAVKNVSINEPFFQGHFPQQPVMPGVLILEALAQTTGILAFTTANIRPSEGALYYLVGVDKARFKRQVEAGDQLRLDIKLTRTMRTVWLFSGTATVDGNVAATAELMCAEKRPES